LDVIKILISPRTDIQLGDSEKKREQEGVSSREHQSSTPVSNERLDAVDCKKYETEVVVAASPVMAVPASEPSEGEVDDQWGYAALSQKKVKWNRRTSSGFGI